MSASVVSGVTFLPRDPRFAGSNPTEFDGFFQNVKILSTGPPGGPESEISGSLKNMKPEKIGLWAKFNRHIQVLVIPKFGGSTRDLEKVTVHWAAMTTPSKQIQMYIQSQTVPYGCPDDYHPSTRIWTGTTDHKVMFLPLCHSGGQIYHNSRNHLMNIH